MEVLVIDGVEYVKASILARRFKYTSDYVGQLCRSGKVDAKLVGRTWYVATDSLTGHKSSRYTKSSSNEKVINQSTEIKRSRIDVEPVLRRETAKSVHAAPGKGSLKGTPANFLSRVNWQPAKYEADTSELLPPLQSNVTQSVRLPVDPAEAERISIKSAERDSIALETEPLPSVALGGTLRVRSLEEVYDEVDFNQENIAISLDSDPETDGAEESVAETILVKNLDRRAERPKLTIIKEPPKKQEKPLDAYTYDVPVTIEPVVAVATPVSFVPTTAPRHRNSTLVVPPTASQSTNRRFLVGLSFVAFFCLLILLVVLGVEQVVRVEDGVLSYTYRFSLIGTF